MPMIKLRTDRDRKVRHICRLTQRNRDLLFEYARMIEALEAQVGPTPAPAPAASTTDAPNHTKSPRAHTVDHVVNEAIATLATDKELLRYRQSIDRAHDHGATAAAASAARTMTSGSRQ